MADKKIYSIVIDGVEQSYNNVTKLYEAVQLLEKGEESARKAQIAATQAKKEYNSQLQQEVKAQQAADGSIKQMQAQLALMRKEYDGLSKSERESEESGKVLLRNIQDLDTELKAAKEATGRFQESVGNYQVATRDLGKELKQLQDSLAEMLANGIKPTDEAFIETAKKAGALKDAMDDASSTIGKFASDTRALDQVIDVGSSLTAVFGTASGVMAMFGDSGERVAQQIQKLQGVMTTLQSLQQLQVNLNKQGTLTNTLYTKATNLLSAAFKGQAASTNVASVAVNGFKKALIATGIGAIIVLIGTLIANFDEISAWFTKVLAPMEKVTQVLWGIGNAVINYVVAPFKALFKLLKGDFKGAFDEMKKGFDVVGSYAEGAAKKASEQEAARQRKMAEDSLKTTDSLIKDNEAKYGSDYKYTEDGKKLYREYFALQLKLADKNSEEYKEILRKQWSFERDLTKKSEDDAKKAADEAKKRNDEWKKAQDEKKKKLEDYQKSLESFTKGTQQLAISNEEKLIETQKKNAKTTDELGLAYDKQILLLKKKNEIELDEIDKQYEELIKKAKEAGESTEDIEKAYQQRLIQFAEEEKAEILTIETDKNKAIEDVKKKATEKILKDNGEAINSEIKQLDSYFKSITELSKNIESKGKWNIIDVDKTRENYTKVIAEQEKYVANLEASKKRIETYYDAQLALYDKDSKEYKDLVEKKKTSMDDLDSKINTTNKSIEDNTKASTEVQQKYYQELSDTIGKAYQAVSEVISGVFDAMNEIFQMQLDEANEKLEEVTERYDEVVEKKEESNQRLAELEEEAKTASGGRAIAIQEQIAREMETNKELANQEKELAKEKEKREKDVAKKEKQMKKTQLAQSLVSGIAQTALGVTQALGAYPPPVSFVMAALVGAMGALNTGIIATQMAKLEDGGLLNGKRHSQGGMRVEGTNIEVEGGEYVVNRISTNRNLDLVEYINTQRRTLTLTDFENYFASPTSTSAPTFKRMYEDGGRLVNLEQISIQSNEDRILDAIAAIDFKPQVAVSEINNVSKNMVDIKELAGSTL